MCAENKQFLINYWVKNDFNTVIELASNHILCDCTNSDDEEDIYIYYGQSYYNMGKPDSSTWVFKKGLKPI